jgi:hypothetical protein
MAGIDDCFFGTSATIASVVMRRAAGALPDDGAAHLGVVVTGGRFSFGNGGDELFGRLSKHVERALTGLAQLRTRSLNAQHIELMIELMGWKGKAVDALFRPRSCKLRRGLGPAPWSAPIPLEKRSPPSKNGTTCGVARRIGWAKSHALDEQLGRK